MQTNSYVAYLALVDAGFTAEQADALVRVYQAKIDADQRDACVTHAEMRAQKVAIVNEMYCALAVSVVLLVAGVAVVFKMFH